MKRSILAMAAGALLLAAAASAQPGPGPGRRLYDPGTVETVSGEVVRVEHVPSPRGMGTGVHLVLRTDSAGILPVRLGPAWYVDQQEVKIGAHDRVEVKGSRVSVGGTSTVIAAVVKKADGQTLVLRNDAGVPQWAGARAHRRQ
jgi:hypothetical protein